MKKILSVDAQDGHDRGFLVGVVRGLLLGLPFLIMCVWGIALYVKDKSAEYPAPWWVAGILKDLERTVGYELGGYLFSVFVWVLFLLFGAMYLFIRLFVR